MKTLVTAHSGCDDTPDNSPAYLAHALRCGADVFEVDVRRRPDGTLYLYHDATDAPCALLSDAFERMRDSRIRINCDLKETGLAQAVLTLAEMYGVQDRVLLTGSVSAEALQDDAVRRRTYWNIPIPHRAEREVPGVVSAWVQSTIALCRKHGVTAINVNCDICSDEVLDALAAAGLAVSAWTVNDPALAARLLSHGIANITSRRPGMVLALRDQR